MVNCADLPGIKCPLAQKWGLGHMVKRRCPLRLTPPGDAIRPDTGGMCQVFRCFGCQMVIILCVPQDNRRELSLLLEATFGVAMMGGCKASSSVLGPIRFPVSV